MEGSAELSAGQLAVLVVVDKSSGPPTVTRTASQIGLPPGVIKRLKLKKVKTSSKRQKRKLARRVSSGPESPAANSKFAERYASPPTSPEGVTFGDFRVRSPPGRASAISARVSGPAILRDIWSRSDHSERRTADSRKLGSDRASNQSAVSRQNPDTRFGLRHKKPI